MPVFVAIFGYGRKDYRDQLIALSRKLGLENDLHIGGWVDHEYVLSYMDLNRVGIVSYVDNHLTRISVPNKVFEFTSLGKPLIIAKLDALVTLFRDAALFYEPGNAQDLVDKIKLLESDKELARKIALNAKEVYEKCKWDLMKLRLYDLYDDLTSKNKNSG
jgi:glycosyltransferase involved in cell wall biosynthesis